MPEIHQHLLSSISDDSRGRDNLGDIQSLAESIERYTSVLPETSGLIHPILIEKSGRLVAGGRRLAAHKLLGRTTIAAHFVEDLPDDSHRELELEENVQRKQFTWQEEGFA